ncbi:MAG: ATP-binding cassette domain-containing protein, partial [Clostridiales bacterium]|nr:ATP-binding cassette domain-containing protein [Clostridiales bacterium]
MAKKKKDNELGIHEYPVIKNMIYCIRHTARHYPLLLLMCVLAVVINVVLPTLTVYLPKMVIEEISNDSVVSKLLMVVLSFTLGIAVLLCLQRFLEKNISNHKLKMNSYYIRKIADKGMTTDYCHQENERFRKLQSESFNICNGYDSNITKTYNTLITLASNALGFVVFLGILIKLNLFIVLLIVALVIFSYLLNKRNIKWLVDHNKDRIIYQQKINYINRVTGDTKYGKDIRLYHMPPWIESIYQTNIKSLSAWYRKYATKLFKTTILDGDLLLLREGIAYAYLLYLALSGGIGVSDFVLYFGVVTGFSAWLGGILGQINSLNSINISINYLRTFLEYPDSYKREQGKVPDKITIPKLIELKNVCYRYEGAEEDTLKNINLTIDLSEHLGVVGLNGAGKTTLVKIICGLCDPTSGVILYDGIDVKEYNRSE